MFNSKGRDVQQSHSQRFETATINQFYFEYNLSNFEL